MRPGGRASVVADMPRSGKGGGGGRGVAVAGGPLHFRNGMWIACARPLNPLALREPWAYQPAHRSEAPA